MILRTTLALLLSCGLSCQCFSQAQPTTPQNTAAPITPQIRIIFRRLSDYIKSEPLDFKTSFEARAAGNQLYHGSVHFLLREPNLIRIDANFDKNYYLVLSDGKFMTIYDLLQSRFAQVKARRSFSEAYGFFTSEIGIESQVIDFFSIAGDIANGSNSRKVISDGSEKIDGRQCDRFIIIGLTGENEWEVWLRKGDISLPCRLIYHSIDGPYQTNEFTWNLSPVVRLKEFVFSPKPGSREVDIGDLHLSPLN